MESEGYLHLLNEDTPFVFNIFFLKKRPCTHSSRMFNYQLFGCIFVTKFNSTAESKPVFIWVMFILEQDLEIENLKATKIVTNHHRLSFL